MPHPPKPAGLSAATNSAQSVGQQPSLTSSALCTIINCPSIMREIVHIQAGQCGNQIGAKVRKASDEKKTPTFSLLFCRYLFIYQFNKVFVQSFSFLNHLNCCSFCTVSIHTYSVLNHEITWK